MKTKKRTHREIQGHFSLPKFNPEKFHTHKALHAVCQHKMDKSEGPQDKIMENFACREEATVSTATQCSHDHIDPLSATRQNFSHFRACCVNADFHPLHIGSAEKIPLFSLKASFCLLFH